MTQGPARLAAAEPRFPGRTLVVRVREAMRAQIGRGDYRPGDRLPSEARLTQEFGVSRTVIREAIAALRADGLVDPRQGAGVFVLEPPAPDAPAFRNLDLARVSSLIEMLELRAAVEGDAAGYAASRRSPAQEQRIVETYEELRALTRAGTPSSEADFRFHLAIAEAANNPRFSEFLRLIGPTIIPRRVFSPDDGAPLPAEFLRLLDSEHTAIVTAILSGDPEAARAAMRAHLIDSQARYCAFLRRIRAGDGEAATG